MIDQSMALFTDLYQLTMMNGYFRRGIGKKRCVFDYFFRQNPLKGGYALFCGLEDFLDYPLIATKASRISLTARGQEYKSPENPAVYPVIISRGIKELFTRLLALHRRG